MSVKFTILGSGSAGNCAYLETDNSRVLVDAGFSPRQIRQRLAAIGRTPENLSAILITHEHSDHISGLLRIGREIEDSDLLQSGNTGSHGLGNQGQMERQTRPAVRRHRKNRPPISWQNWNGGLFQTGDGFELNDLWVETFPIPHDAQDPVGFLFRTAAREMWGSSPILGYMTKLVLERIRLANVLVLESNHDVKLLQDSRRSWALKQRILGRHGHLSNEAAAEAAAEIMSARLTHLYLAHLSRECNRPEIATRVMTERLNQIGARHVQLRHAPQDLPSETLEL